MADLIYHNITVVLVWPSGVVCRVDTYSDNWIEAGFQLSDGRTLMKGRYFCTMSAEEICG